MFPSTLTSFNYPSASDRLNNPSHSALHNVVSSALGQVETVIGLSGDNSVLGTILGDLRSPASGGGGHVQAVNKGGTGQISYTKGDLLVASSSSVLSKLSISSVTGEFLQVDPNQSGGIKWGSGANKLLVTSSVVNIDKWQSSAINVLFAASVTGSLLGINGAIKYTGAFTKLNMNDQLTIKVNLGNNSVVSMVTDGGGIGSVIGSGKLEGMIIANSSSTIQLGYAHLESGNNYVDGGGSSKVMRARAYGYGQSSVSTSSPQDLIITGQFNGNTSANSILTGFFVVEKIV